MGLRPSDSKNSLEKLIAALTEKTAVDESMITKGTKRKIVMDKYVKAT
jgi:hypothetical protein